MDRQQERPHGEPLLGDADDDHDYPTSDDDDINPADYDYPTDDDYYYRATYDDHDDRAEHDDDHDQVNDDDYYPGLDDHVRACYVDLDTDADDDAPARP